MRCSTFNLRLVRLLCVQPPRTMPATASAFKHPSSANYVGVDFRKHPLLYRIGKGEQGVLLAEPYKSEILPHWRFKTPEIARESARKIFSLYEDYKTAGDFVGMDMSRKYLQMGYTRSMRYARHKSGKKYDGPVPLDKKGVSGAHGRKELKLDVDEQKRASAEVFHEYYQMVLNDPDYIKAKQDWQIMEKRNTIKGVAV